MASDRATRRNRVQPYTSSSPPNGPVYSLDNFTSAQRSIIDSEVAKSLEELQLTLSSIKRTHTGTRVLAPNTLTGYEGHLRTLNYFLALIGDWSSMLILRDDAPDFAPAIRDKSLALFIDWKTLPAGTIMKKRDGEIIKDAFGRDLIADGCWKAPGNTTPFSAAVSALHIARGFKGMAYEEECESCMAKYRNSGDVSGCFHHAGRAHLWRRGNSRLSNLYTDRLSKLVRVDMKGYMAQGDSPLTPQELLDVRTKLLSTNCIEDFRLWTMILVSTKLFLRSDEICRFNPELQFLPELTIKREEAVSAMAVLIQGKRDTTPVILYLWRDDDIPEFDAIIQLLAWVHVSKYSGGPLFRKDLNDGNEEPIPAKRYLNDCKDVFMKVTERRGPWGTHSARKTGWLFGAWGNASDVSLAQDSRHAGLDQAMRYKQDALSQLEIARASR